MRTVELLVLVLVSLILVGCGKAEGVLNGCDCTHNLDCSGGYCKSGLCTQVDANKKLVRFGCKAHDDCGCGAYCISFAYNYASLHYDNGCLAANQVVQHGYLCVVPCATTKNCPQGMQCSTADATPKTGSNGQTCKDTGITHDYGTLNKSQHEKLWEDVKTPGYCVW